MFKLNHAKRLPTKSFSSSKQSNSAYILWGPDNAEEIYQNMKTNKNKPPIADPEGQEETVTRPETLAGKSSILKRLRWP